jgi:hypothetical protein
MAVTGSYLRSRRLTFDMTGAQKAQPFGHPLDGGLGVIRGCSETELHDVPSLSFARQFFEPGFSEHRHKTHETVAGRIGVYRVRL